MASSPGACASSTRAAGDLADGSRQVADGTGVLADKVNGVADKVGPFLKDNEKSIGDTARLVADSAAGIRHNLDTLVKTAPVAAKGAHTASDALSAVYRARCETLPLPDAACPDLKKARQAAADVAEVADDVNSLISDQNGDLDRLDKNLGTLQKQAQALADRSPHLSEDLTDAVSKVNKLNEGAEKVAAGAKKLRAGLGTAKTGAADLDTGVGKLKTGAGTLDEGMYKLVGGSGQLAGGLHDGAGQIPDYDRQDRDLRTQVMADPVKLASKDLHKAPNYGTGFAPYFIPLSLWVGAMVAYMLIQPLNRRALAVGASAWRIALAGWLPVAALGVLQTVALMSVLHWAIGLEMVRAAGTVGFLCLVTACFAALVQWLNARFGAAGRILVLALLMLQLTSAGGTYPVQTSPGFFNAIHPFLPMSYVVEALHAAHHGRRSRTGLAGVRRPHGVHRGRARAHRPVGTPQAGVDPRPSAPRAEPVTIRAMESSSTTAGGGRREATRQKLYEAAVTLIAEQGFSATTVDEIAERAGVAKGTVYYNFASKSVLFEELLRHGVGLLTASLREAAERTEQDGGTRVDALDAMIRAGLAFINRYPAFTQLYVAELWRTNRAWQSTLMVVRQEAVAVVEGVLREGVANGELSDEIDVPLTAAALVGMVLVAALDWQAFQPERSWTTSTRRCRGCSRAV